MNLERRKFSSLTSDQWSVTFKDVQRVLLKILVEEVREKEKIK